MLRMALVVRCDNSRLSLDACGSMVLYMPSLLIYILDTALIATSFFNTIVMLWLGLTVLLNAERRTWGTWASGGGLLFGALFFAIHSTVVAQAIWNIGREMAVWWRVGWAPFIAAPYLWYLLMAWYSGTLRTRLHTLAAFVIGSLGAAAMVLLVVANPLPSYSEVVQRAPVAVYSVAGVPAAVLIYPAFSVLCIVLALVALRRPSASQRFMGNLGRMRARPWLVGASFALLVVSVVAGIGSGWLLNRVREGEAPLLSARSLAAIIFFDLTLSALIALVVVLLGNAVSAYEIFTGKALPRGGLARYWRGTLLLAAAYGLLVGASTDLPFAPAYQLVAITLLVSSLYAVLSWRAFVERERGVEQLRPFVANPHLYEQWLGPASPPERDLLAPFHTLCADVLTTRVAFLVPLGPLASLGVETLEYPERGKRREGEKNMLASSSSLLPLSASSQELGAMTNTFAPQQLCMPIEPRRFGGAVWAVPLWSERGLIGVLLLGEKRSGGLYTQEEIEIARAASERLLDTQASAELAQRLVALQRQRLAESQVLDRRTRRVLHDDVLPLIHAAMLALQTQTIDDDRWTEEPYSPPTAHPPPSTEQATVLLADAHHQIANLLRELPPTAEPELLKLGLVGALRHIVEGELRGAFDRVEWSVEPDVKPAAAALSPLHAEVLYYAAREVIRNAARHGRGGDAARPLELSVTLAHDHELSIIIEDDGVGPGSGGGSGGSGQGIHLHSTLLAVLGGSLSTEHRVGGGARFVLALPCE